MEHGKYHVTLSQCHNGVTEVTDGHITVTVTVGHMGEQAHSHSSKVYK